MLNVQRYSVLVNLIIGECGVGGRFAGVGDRGIRGATGSAAAVRGLASAPAGEIADLPSPLVVTAPASPSLIYEKDSVPTRAHPRAIAGPPSNRAASVTERSLCLRQTRGVPVPAETKKRSAGNELRFPDS